MGKKAYILVDEYDRPSNYLLGKLLATKSDDPNYINKKEEHDQISGMISSMLCEVGKTHPEYTEKVIMTGIMDVLKRDAGSGFNNVSVYGILDENFSEYFGIIEDNIVHEKGELNEYLKQGGFKECDIKQNKDLRNWFKENYNGYNIPTLSDAAIKVYTPYSLIKCLKSKFVDKARNKPINSKIEYKEAPNDWVNSGEIFNSIGLGNIDKKLLVKFDYLLKNDNKGINLQYDKYIDIKKGIKINQESKVANILINHGYLTPKDAGNKNVFKFPNKEVRNYFAKNYLQYWENWIEDKFDGVGLVDFIKSYINKASNGKELEKIINGVLQKSKATSGKEAENDFQTLMNSVFFLYNIFHPDPAYKVCGEYDSFPSYNGKYRIDGAIFPISAENNTIIHEYKKTDEDRDKPAFLKLRESISQPFERGYLISAFDKDELNIQNNISSGFKPKNLNKNWKNLIIRGMTFFYDTNNDNNKSTWKVLIKDVIFRKEEAKKIINKICGIQSKQNKSDYEERLKELAKVIEENKGTTIKHDSDIYEILSKEDGYSSLSKEEEFIDSFVESIGINRFGDKSKQALRDFMIHENKNYNTKKSFEYALKKQIIINKIC